MGGAKSGNVASALSAEVFAESVSRYAAPRISNGVLTLDSDDACLILDDAAHDANTAVYKKSQTSPDYQGMGTTLVAALFCGDIVYVVNVGDSRLYLISDGTMTQITHDHSYVQHLIDSGSLTAEEARTHPFRNRITRAVRHMGEAGGGHLFGGSPEPRYVLSASLLGRTFGSADVG